MLVETRPPTPLRVFVAGAGLRQGDIAAAAGCSRSHLSAIVAGDRRPSPALALRLADALGVRVSALETAIGASWAS